nr:flagellar FliJ family protein [uncultured Anaeromusa sp.]
MKRFRFRLEVLLGVRRRKCDEAKLALAEASRRVQETVDFLHKLWGERTEAIAWFTAQQSKGQLTAAMLPLYDAYQIASYNREKELIAEKEARELARQECLLKLEEAVKQLKAVETLKETQYQQYAYESLLEEQKILDEIGMQLYLREEGER